MNHIKNEAFDSRLSEYRMKVERDLSRLIGFKNLGMISEDHANLHEQIDELRSMLESLTIENLEKEFRPNLAERAKDNEHSIFRVALERLEKFIPTHESMSARLADSIGQSNVLRKTREDLLMPTKQTKMQMLQDKITELTQRLAIKQAKSPQKR